MTLTYFYQDHLIYKPSKDIKRTPEESGVPYKDIFIHTPDGMRLHGWLTLGNQSPYVVLFMHGNAGNIASTTSFISTFHELGFASLVIDYRGYGLSEGKPNEAGLLLDAKTAWHYLTQTLGYDADHIIVVGYSLGGAVAASLLNYYKPAALVILSAFTSIADIAKHHYPWLPVSLIQKSHYDTLSFLDKCDIPLLIMHGKTDGVVPYDMAPILFERAPSERKHLLSLDGGHTFYWHQHPEFTRLLRTHLMPLLTASG